MIDAAVRVRAEAALAGVEQEEGVRILLAAESGSRAWGFPSRDSDYDVRFIFVRPWADYLSVSSMRDVIERPVQAALDLGGWDLRKALGLLIRSNAVVLEWLSSPVTYRSDSAAASILRGLAGVAAHMPALAYHYDRLARGAWHAGEDDLRLKSYCYALRPALCLLWMRDRGTPPPMAMPALLDGLALPPGVREAIGAVLARKAEVEESHTAPRHPVLERFLAAALTPAAPRPAAWDRERARIAADQAFRKIVLAGTNLA